LGADDTGRRVSRTGCASGIDIGVPSVGHAARSWKGLQVSHAVNGRPPKVSKTQLSQGASSAC
jgi:hypothetical protein